MENLNYILIAVLIVIAIGIIQGYRKGFLRLAVSAAGLILVVLIVTKISPYVSNFMITNTSIYDSVRQKIITIYEEKALDEDNNKSQEEQSQVIKSYEFPDVISDALISNNNQDIYTSLAVTLFKEYIAGYLARIMIKAGCFCGLFILLWIVQICIFSAIKVLEKIPVLKFLNRLLGMGLGVMTSLLFVWVFFVASLLLFGNSLGNYVLIQINRSEILTYLFNNNLLLRLIL